MTIKEVETMTGLARSNIRFYEKENLIQPTRNERNGYREYTEENVQDIKKIAYLRTLGISIEDIHKIINHKASLMEIISEQEKILGDQIVDLEKAKSICRQMMNSQPISYENLNIEAYVPELPKYWEGNKKLFQLDSVSFLHMWGGTIVWAVITTLCLLVALCCYSNLPDLIPIQYSGGYVSSSVKKIYIFAYPVACIIIRLFFRSIFRWKLNISVQLFNDLISDYLTNFMCFTALSVEIFSILFVYGYVKNIVLLLIVNAVVFVILLIKGITKLSLNL